MRTVGSEGQQRNERFAYLDALRGYAILLVMAVHASQYVVLPPLARGLADLGAHGVQLFYVVSAITLCLSWHARTDGARAFYIRRLFRLAPMFWLAIVFFVSVQGLGPRELAPDGIGARHVTLAFAFLHGFVPDAISSVVPGSWTIAVEAMFYAVFPLLITAIRSFRLALAAIAIALAVDVLQYLLIRSLLLPGASPAWETVFRNFSQMNLLHQLPCFLMGIAAYWYMRERSELTPPIPLVLAAGATPALCILFLRAVAGIPAAGFWQASAAAFAFAAAAVVLNATSPKALVNPVICWIGKVSYSAYLVHFALIVLFPSAWHATGHAIPDAALLFVVLAAATIGISSATYLLIERPAIRFGNALLEQRARAAMENG